MGDFTNTVNFGGGNATAGSGFAVFVAGYASANGAFLWGDSYGATGTASAHSVSVFRNTTAVGGGFSSAAGFGGTSLTSAGSLDGFIARYVK